MINLLHALTRDEEWWGLFQSKAKQELILWFLKVNDIMKVKEGSFLFSSFANMLLSGYVLLLLSFDF